MFFDVVILGAGAAGLMCAQLAAKRGQKVLLVEHMSKVGSKILISGGGRCNFTNLNVSAANFVSENPHFCKSALSRYTPNDFIDLVKSHGVAFHEKKLGQLFCDHSARDIVKILQTECEKAGVEILLSTEIKDVKLLEDQGEARFELLLNSKKVMAAKLVVATGGLSIPKIGSSSFGYKLAQHFGLKVVPTRPALDGFTITDPAYASLKDLMGVSVDCILTANQQSFRENILFTHKGISGPAALQGSLYWTESSDVFINMLPDLSLKDLLFKKKEKSSQHLSAFLSEHLPQRVVEVFCENFLTSKELTKIPLCQVADKLLEQWAAEIQNWKIRPSGTVGYAKAEVTKGGVCTSELSSKTMESHKVKGLYFIGEVVDVSGWLGGYNFQWAWASAAAAANSFDSA